MFIFIFLTFLHKNSVRNRGECLLFKGLRITYHSVNFRVPISHAYIWHNYQQIADLLIVHCTQYKASIINICT